jgi:DNA-directed RNA polymerase II subunit RPB2
MSSSKTMEQTTMNDDDNDNMNKKEQQDSRCHLNLETPWTIIGSYFKDQPLNRLVRHQLESYNNFVEYQLIKTIEMFNKHEPITSPKEFNPIHKKNNFEIYVSFENFQMEKPQIYELNGVKNDMLPNKARLRNFTYSSAMFLDINIQTVVRSGETMENMQIYNKVLPKIHIGKLPIMLKSVICMLSEYKHIEPALIGECKFDAGGYFIINGSEKTVLGQERAAENKVYVYNIKNNTKYLWQAEVKSVPDFKCISPKQINMMVSSKNNGFGYPLVIQLPRIKQPIPVFIVFRALGIVADKDICSYILQNVDEYIHSTVIKKQELIYYLQASIIDANKYLTEEDCLKYITNMVMYTPLNMDKETGIKKKHDFALDILNNDLFPHCATKTQKIYYLGYMAYKLLLVANEMAPQDDRDSYLNKRIDLTGILINNLFRNYFNKFVKDMERQIIKEIDIGPWRATEDYENIINQTNIYKIFKPTTIENGLKRALSTGDFSIKHSGNNNKVGVAQVLNRLTYTSGLSHLRRISTPTDKSGKLIPPRKLHNTTWGFLCPAETPEGQSVGIVKNLAYMCHVTIPSDPIPIHEYFALLAQQPDSGYSVIGTDPLVLYNKVKVFVNGAWIGITTNPIELFKQLKDKKYKGIFNIYTSIVFDYAAKELRICNDGGRVTRPVLRVNPETRLPFYTKKIIDKLESGELKWEHLLIGYSTNNTESKSEEIMQILAKDMKDDFDFDKQGLRSSVEKCKQFYDSWKEMLIENSIIEYIDQDEQNYSLIAMNTNDLMDESNVLKKYTHCEIHQSTMFGILASCIPFPERNQSPRNTYQSAQAKQAIGIYASNFYERMDKTAYILNYPQRPLIETRLMDMIHLNQIPSGCNVTVAIMTHTGYNQEDSILINKGSIDRGMFLATIYHTEKDEDKQKINGDEEIRCKPNPAITKKMKFGDYSKVNSVGFMPENTLVNNKDIIISKVTPIKENRNDDTQRIKYEDQSKMYRTSEETYIDKNYINKNGDGYSFAKVRLRTTRKPGIGDKFASRAGQKGTTGLIINEEDMPFTANGKRPDIIINPHAIPSRMTIAQLMETILTTVLIDLGLFGDGTAFSELTVEEISKKLAELGHESYGNEILYNPYTGQQHDCSVFIGTVFYQRLKHMVNDKVHSRANGPMVNLTRQPMEGRSREGGHRFGEMERDAAIGHGAAGLVHERLYVSSDKYETFVCKCCGFSAVFNAKDKIFYCKMCNNMTDFRRVEIPYACKLLFQELQAMNIGARYITDH